MRASGAVQVSVEGCAMRSAEVTRLVQLELGSVLAAGADASAYRVSIQCVGPDLRISIFDPLTKKSLARTVLAPPPSQPEPERLVALTVAQLYRAAWLELAAEDPSPLPPAEPRDRPPDEVASARRAAVQALGEPPADNHSGGAPARPAASQGVSPPPVPSAPAWPEHRSWAIGAALGARARHLESPVLFPSLEGSAAWALPGRAFWLSVHGGLEWADIARATGMLETLLVRGGLGLGMEPLVSGRWSGVVEATGGLTYVTISGHAARPPYAGRQIGGAGFDGSVALGLALRLGAVRVEAMSRFGLLVGTPTGIVAGDADLSLDGPWAAAELRLRWGG